MSVEIAGSGRTAAIIQARFGSSRLPGKVLMHLAEETVVHHVVRRAQAIAGVDVVCLATTKETADDAVAAEGKRAGADVFRGEENDVLGRYLAASRRLGADVILRITCDCPLIDPAVCDQALELRDGRGADYASVNTLAPEWPHGLDCEVFTRDLLERAAAAEKGAFNREHVTVWMLERSEVERAALPGPGGLAASQRWTLDYPEDFAFLDALFQYLPAPPALPGWRDVLAVVENHPEITRMNSAYVQAQAPA